MLSILNPLKINQCFLSFFLWKWTLCLMWPVTNLLKCWKTCFRCFKQKACGLPFMFPHVIAVIRFSHLLSLCLTFCSILFNYSVYHYGNSAVIKGEDSAGIPTLQSGSKALAAQTLLILPSTVPAVQSIDANRVSVLTRTKLVLL